MSTIYQAFPSAAHAELAKYLWDETTTLSEADSEVVARVVLQGFTVVRRRTTSTLVPHDGSPTPTVKDSLTVQSSSPEPPDNCPQNTTQEKT